MPFHFRQATKFKIKVTGLWYPFKVIRVHLVAERLRAYMSCIAISLLFGVPYGLLDCGLPGSVLMRSIQVVVTELQGCRLQPVVGGGA